jgi:hypothetical protein
MTALDVVWAERAAPWGYNCGRIESTMSDRLAADAGKALVTICRR